MCLKFYILWKTYGIEVFAENVDCLYGLGQTFAKMVKNHPSFELALEPQTNIVCFRYVQKDLSNSELNQLNKTIRQKLLEDSEFYIVQAVLNDTVYLRVTLMNPMTGEMHLNHLLEKIGNMGI
jgi:L-2,4-diaminobutyrate decarboxylase